MPIIQLTPDLKCASCCCCGKLNYFAWRGASNLQNCPCIAHTLRIENQNQSMPCTVAKCKVMKDAQVYQVKAEDFGKPSKFLYLDCCDFLSVHPLASGKKGLNQQHKNKT
eukprot:TRINITY_DN10694_c0_g1_i1.p1 TRINITY_DN10694_c0_g1~~TRINITY_DN10694_c0_g1_i1.p1  ORF type:complete len:110 (+),score=9.13 TRINITY_DN10694_c0_g1_i1:219-548(+)